MCLRKRKTNGASERAVNEAAQHVRDVKARGPEVTELVSDLREIRRKNHFAEQLYIMMLNKDGGIGST